jgi:DNA-binding transcriptional regulator YhcF (GntR family)
MNRRADVSAELRRRVSGGLHLGLLRPGDRFGSARATASELGTDYRVVSAAVRLLEEEGLLHLRHRAGIFVGARPYRGEEEPLPRLAACLVHVLAEEISCGGSVRGFADAARRCLDVVRPRVVCLECNEDQRDAMCRELGSLYGMETVSAPIEGLDEASAQLRAADLLVSTSDHAGALRRLAARLDKPCIVVTLDPAQRADVARALSEGPLYFVGTDPLWAAKARAIWGGLRGAANNLRHLTLGIDPLESIPAAARLMVMPGARRRLADNPLLARALPHRGFGRDTTRQLLAFLVRANLAAYPR